MLNDMLCNNVNNVREAVNSVIFSIERDFMLLKKRLQFSYHGSIGLKIVKSKMPGL